jgi:hypothetical protein
MGNPGFFPTASIPYPGGTSTSGNPALPAHVSQLNPGVSPSFKQSYYQVMCHTPVLTSRTEASIRVPRMFKSHA